MKSNLDNQFDEAQKAIVSTSLHYWTLYSTIDELCDQLEKRIATADQRTVRADKRLIARARSLAKRFKHETEQIGNTLHPRQQLS